jgi:hypothetical protein
MILEQARSKFQKKFPVIIDEVQIIIHSKFELFPSNRF